MKNEDILQRYKDKRPEIQEYMTMLVESLKSKYGEVPDEFIISLDLLVMNLDVLFDSVKEIQEKGMTDTDKYRGEKKSAAAQAFWNSQNYITKILSQFGWSPAAKSKIRENTDKADVQKFLEELTK